MGLDLLPVLLHSENAPVTPHHGRRRQRRHRAHLLSPLPDGDPVKGIVEVVDVDPVGGGQDDVAVEASVTSSQPHHGGAYFGWTQKGLVKPTKGGGAWEESPSFHTFFIRGEGQLAGLWRAALVVCRHHRQEVGAPLVRQLQLGPGSPGVREPFSKAPGVDPAGNKKHRTFQQPADDVASEHVLF